jgi:drug/metabolite transporter (DMT)-like permease
MSSPNTGHKNLISGMFISMFLWGLSWPSGKVLSGFCSPVNFTAYRYLLVVLSMLFMLPAVKMNYTISRKGFWPVLLSGSLLCLYSYFMVMGLKNGSAGSGGVLVTTLNPIVSYTINILLKRKLPARMEQAGILLGIVAGLILLKVWDNSALLKGGNVYFLLAAITWAIMSKFTAMGGKYGSSISFSLWQYLVTLLCLVPFINYTEMAVAVHISNYLFWMNLVFGSVIVTAGATTVYFYTTTRLGAEKASSFIFLVPFAAAISSWFLLGEHIHWHTLLGGIMGISAVYLINSTALKNRKKSAA